MPFYLFVWSNEIEGHIAQHGVTPDEFEEGVCDPDSLSQSRSSEREVAFGETSSGKYLICVYQFLDDTTVIPVTAYEVED